MAVAVENILINTGYSPYNQLLTIKKKRDSSNKCINGTLLLFPRAGEGHRIRGSWRAARVTEPVLTTFPLNKICEKLSGPTVKDHSLYLFYISFWD